MKDEKLHFFREPITTIPLPDKFTYPFHYIPHPLCILATREVQTYLAGQKIWHEELQKGKMFGVLVVRSSAGDIGYLAAFSGNLAHSNEHAFFVPPVYDLLRPDGFFKAEEEQISLLNHRIEALLCAEDYRLALTKYAQCREQADEALRTAKANLQAEKAKRDKLRGESLLSEEQQAALIRESQFQKAEYKRLNLKWKDELAQCEAAVKEYEAEILRLKQERKSRSAALQLKLFKQFRMRNALGEVKDLCELFAPTSQRIPPAGAGECAAPKLLQYAYRKGLEPLAMAEFWWGDSPVAEIRRHGHFYPACQGKCAPILAFMLQGLKVEANPLADNHSSAACPEIVYEDADLLVVNKPAGLLSVPGKEAPRSLLEYLREMRPDEKELYMVHRLDMATSGLLLVAKTKEAYCHLQAQFKHRTVKKRYVAWLEGTVASDSGAITLPLAPDWLDRPRQKVDYAEGKPAYTDYQVIRRTEHRTLIAFYPKTGRTHQLRVHAAHPDGLNAPIVGDRLYGTPSDRLYLHAESIEFTHPRTGERLNFERQNDFPSF